MRFGVVSSGLRILKGSFRVVAQALGIVIGVLRGSLGFLRLRQGVLHLLNQVLCAQEQIVGLATRACGVFGMLARGVGMAFTLRHKIARLPGQRARLAGVAGGAGGRIGGLLQILLGCVAKAAHFACQFFALLCQGFNSGRLAIRLPCGMGGRIGVSAGSLCSTSGLNGLCLRLTCRRGCLARMFGGRRCGGVRVAGRPVCVAGRCLCGSCVPLSFIGGCRRGGRMRGGFGG